MPNRRTSARRKIEMVTPAEIPEEALLSFLRDLPGALILRNHDVIANLERGGDVDVLARHIDDAECRLIAAFGIPLFFFGHSYVRSYRYQWGQVDLWPDLQWKGAVYLDNLLVFEAMETSPDGLPRLRTAHEAVVSWLTSLLLGGFFNKRYRGVIVEAAHTDHAVLHDALCAAAGRRWRQRLLKAAVAGTPEDSERWANALRRSVRAQAFRRDTLGTLRRWFAYYTAAAKLRLDPPMPWVVLLGSDGSGKPTLVEALKKRLVRSRALDEVRVFHWRPGVLLPGRGDGGPVTDPHAKPAHGLFRSVVKLVFLLADWWLGYWRHLAHLRLKKCLVVFDRCYLDMLVDPKRYRYGGPIGLARFAARLAPVPDLTVVLDAPPDVAHSRKLEVSLSETARQREAYLDLARRTPGARIVDTSRPVHEVAAEVEGLVLGLMAERTRRRLGL